MKKIVFGVLALALTLTGCATASTPADLTAVHYKGGVGSAKKFVDCLSPSTRSGFHPSDKYYAYPTRQVSYDATGGEASESNPFKVVSDDSAELYVPATVTFTMKTDCETLRKMHETIGSRFSAAFDASGTSADENEGWNDMLDFVIGKPLDATLDRVAQEYAWRDMWSQPEAKAEMEKAASQQIQALVARQAGGDFFEGFSILLQKPDPVDAGLKQAIADEQAMVARANAKEVQAAADERAAQARKAVAEAEAANKRAEIDGFGGFDNYLCIYMADKGLNCEQPTYIWGGNQPR